MEKECNLKKEMCDPKQELMPLNDNCIRHAIYGLVPGNATEYKVPSFPPIPFPS